MSETNAFEKGRQSGIVATLCLRLERAESALTALRERMRWVPVGERLPEDGVDVLAVSNNGVTDAYVLLDMDGLPDWRRGDYQIRGVTHWQPLPAAPEVPQ